MRKYCLTYDAKNSDDWEGEELKLKISKLLIENEAINLQSPTASTILFEDNADIERIREWNAVLVNLKKDIYYYVCLVGRKKEEYLDRNEGDLKLNKNFRNLLNSL